MSTTKANFVSQTSAVLEGTTVGAAGAVVALSPEAAATDSRGSGGTILDKFLMDLSTAGFAKNGACTFALSGTTPVTLTLVDLTSATASNAGDTSFATWNQLNFYNTGAADLTIAQGSSSGARLGFAGTTPTVTVPAGGHVILDNPAGSAVDSTHKNITITPTSGGSCAVSVGGA
jgi:hypothetical protein